MRKSAGSGKSRLLVDMTSLAVTDNDAPHSRASKGIGTSWIVRY
jgi:hypothetical protein